MKQSGGFTLIEFVIVLVIIGMITAVVWPGDRDYMRRMEKATTAAPAGNCYIEFSQSVSAKAIAMFLGVHGTKFEIVAMKLEDRDQLLLKRKDCDK